MNIRIFPLLVFAVLAGFWGAPDLFASDLEDFISADLASALLAGEKPVQTQFRNVLPVMLPEHEVLKELVASVREELNPSVMVETLHIYEKPAAAEKGAWSEVEFAGLYNSVLALSTLAGLQYFSASRGIMRTFYETSQIIDSPSSKRPLPDPVYSRPQTELTIYARQKDLTFGDNIYKYDFFTETGILVFTQQNLTSLMAGIIPAVGKNKLRSVVAVLDAGNYLLVYAASMAKAVSLPGMNERVGNSFASRAEAVLGWFSDRADEAFAKAHP